MFVTSETRMILDMRVVLTDDVFDIRDGEWNVSHWTFSYDGLYLIDDATGNAFKTADPWGKITEMIYDIDADGISTNDFGVKDWEDCEACWDASRYNVNGRCFNHTEEN